MSRSGRSATSTSFGRNVPRLFVVGLLVAVVASLSGSSASAVGTKARFSRAPVSGSFNPASLPQGLRDEAVTVMLQLRGAPVTVVDAAHDGRLSKSRKDAIRDSLRTAQRPVVRSARGLGATVEGTFQLVYNGVQVRVEASRIPALKRIPGVTAVRVMHPMKPDNTHGVPLVGGPQVWGGVPGYTGTGIKVGIIDTGVDYTHADFGGPGTEAAYDDALAHDTEPANPAFFGPGAPRVKGGADLVGDDYDGANTPTPDDNPLDCAGHGTHVAGTAAGSGVLSNGSTFTGPYDANTVASNTWNVGPGVAPQADIYAIRVFGCSGSTEQTVAAIEWAVDHGMDVINMSLGSSYGYKNDPSAAASTNAAADGVVVVASAGNSGQAQYITGSPATANGALSVAANDPLPSFPGSDITLSTGPTVTAIEANGISTAGLGTLPVKVLPDGFGGISLGCDPNEYINAGVSGDLVVVKRGTCARVARAIYGQQAGAAAVLMVNNATTYPPYEGQITSNPDTGQPFTVTIPFLGVPSTDGPTFLAADGGTATFADTFIPNPTYLQLASFTSGGPRSGDSWLKPDVTAPGVSIASAGMGTGNGPAVLSGTSMAAPHTTGVAALVAQAHPDWNRSSYVRAAIGNTADPSLSLPYSAQLAGAGLVQAPPAVATDVVALGRRQTAALSFGFRELSHDLTTTRKITVVNTGDDPATFTLGTAHDAGSPHSVVVGPSVTVPAHDSKAVPVELHIPAATAGDSSAFHDVAGLVTLTPQGGDNNGVALSVPYYLVEQATSHVHTSIVRDSATSASATTTNAGGVISGNADWYVWGISDPQYDGGAGADIRAVGVQSAPGVLAFAVDTWSRWSNPASVEPDIYVDVNGDTIDDYVVFSADYGRLTTGSSNGQAATAVLDLRTNSGSIHYFTDATFDGRSMTLPADISQLCEAGSPCLSAGNPRLTYRVEAFSRDGSEDDAVGPGSYNAFTPAISNGMYDTVAPGGTALESLTIDTTEGALTPFLGVMVVTHDNKLPAEAQLISVPLSP